ncbi:MAG: type I 3-dehydroquinate dehydratase [Scrofimicrobium sp.]
MADLLERFRDQDGVVAVVPLTSKTLKETRTEWAEAASAGADMVEWRLDWLEPKRSSKKVSLRKVAEVASEMRGLTGVPVLATYRTAAEGGAKRRGLVDDEDLDYDRLLRSAAQWADAVDVEYQRAGANELIREIRDEVPVVGSFHVLIPIHSPESFEGWLAEAAASGADVAKLSAMMDGPRSAEAIREAQMWATQNLDIPSVVLGMGSGGKQTRLGDAARRSAFTFATVGRESAPGQPTLRELRESL